MLNVDLSIRDGDGLAVVAVRGELDLTNAPGVASHLITAAAVCGPLVIVDLKGLNAIGYCGLAVLLRIRKWNRRNGGDLPLAALQPPVRRVLEATGLIDVFSVYHSVEAAARDAGQVQRWTQAAPRPAQGTVVYRPEQWRPLHRISCHSPACQRWAAVCRCRCYDPAWQIYKYKRKCYYVSECTVTYLPALDLGGFVRSSRETEVGMAAFPSQVVSAPLLTVSVISGPASVAEPAPGSPPPPDRRFNPAPPDRRFNRDLAGLDDQALLGIVRLLPQDSERRMAACELLVTRYSGLVWSCARRYMRRPDLAEDLVQVGYVGLLKAINNFDPSLCRSLATYAHPCISGEIKRHFRDKRWQVHVQRSVQELILRVRAATEPLTQDLGRTPTESDLARHLGVSREDLRQAQRAELAFQPSSLDAPLAGQAGLTTLADYLGGADPRLDHMLTMQAVATHWGELTPREQDILRMDCRDGMTQTEIGQRLSISQMHVSRLRAHALGHLRSRLLDPEDTPALARHDGAPSRRRSVAEAAVSG